VTYPLSCSGSSSNFQPFESTLNTRCRCRFPLVLKLSATALHLSPQVNGSTVNVGIDPSKVVITKVKMDKDRKATMDRKGKAGKGSAEMAVSAHVSF
jgi:hypothetical protein